MEFQINCRRICLLWLALLPAASHASAQYVPSTASGFTRYSPAPKPTFTGPVNVGTILILFPDTELAGGIPQFKKDLDSMNGLSQEDYFKIYSNGITWPVAKIYPGENEADIFHAPQFYGYYCKFDFWHNPIGWHSTEEGQKRAGQLRSAALAAARSRAPGASFKAMAYCYITTRIADPEQRPDIRRFYAAARGKNPQDYPDPLVKQTSKPKKPPPELTMWDKPMDTWGFYQPGVAWGEPMWPNSIIQFNNASAGTFAHEFGHVLGAPDLYRVGRPNDGIGGSPVLLTYGPTATAFSRFYHHGFVSQKNYPTITQSGTYTLSPRHIKPTGDEALGFIIPSRHPHYFYEIEYIYGENPALGAGGGDEVRTEKSGQSYFNGGVEGVIISILDLRESNYLGSPDGMYTYRPNDPWFRGHGDTRHCLFGTQYSRTEFNMQTERSSRLPNLLDGGVSIKNITEHQGTATFDVVIDRQPLTSAEYDRSLLPQVKLEPIDQILPTSFRMTLTTKFRGEPLVDQFGMCWSTNKNPQISNGNFTLANNNYDMNHGRAIDLKPDTTYYVRGWATNAKGTRYSDEELTVKTLPMASEITEAGPLLLDSFSNNHWLHDQFSNDAYDGYGKKTESYESYAPVAVLAKLAAYYHPDNILAKHSNVAPNPQHGDTLGPGHELIVDVDPKAGTSKAVVNFGRLHYDPFESDPPWRTSETLCLFEEMRERSRIAKMHAMDLDRQFLTGFDQIFRHKLKPQFVHVTPENLDATIKLVRTELVNSRPVMVIEIPQQTASADLRTQWGLIDGFRDGNSFHVDFPLDTEFLKDRQSFKTLDELMVKSYDLALMTHISF